MVIKMKKKKKPSGSVIVTELVTTDIHHLKPCGMFKLPN